KAIHRERNDPRAQAWLTLLLGEVCLPEEPEPDERDLVLKAIHRLSPERRRIVELMMIRGLNDAQAMAEVGLTPAAFRTARCGAIKYVREVLKIEVKKPQVGSRRVPAQLPAAPAPLARAATKAANS